MDADQLTADQVRLLRVLKRRGALRARGARSGPAKELIDAGLIRTIKRGGADAILVLSGKGLRLAEAPIEI